MADIVKIKDRAGVIAEIQTNSVMSLPNQPRITPEDLKKQFVKPIIDTNKSLVNAIDTVIGELNEKIPSDIDAHNESDLSHADIRQAVANNASAINTETLNRQSADNALDGRIDVLEAFKSNLDVNITDEITQAVAVETNAREQAIEDLQDIYVKQTDATKVEASETNGNIKVDNEEVVVYDDTDVLQKITDDIATHNASGTAHTGIRNAVAEAKAIAEGKSRARVFATETALDAWLAIPENVASLLVGDNFYIEETDKPDYWWNGTNKVKLETEKVDLTEYVKTADLPTVPTKTSDLTNDSGFLTALPTHNHDDAYYKKSETYTKAQTDALVGNLQGQTQELKSITTQPSGTFEIGDLYYNSSTKGLYYWNGSSWQLTGVGEPLAGVIYSFNGILYFWDESALNLIQIGAGGTGGWGLTIKEGFFA